MRSMRLWFSRSRSVMNKFFGVAAAAALTVSLTGCPGGASVQTDYDHQANFSQFHTFSFAHVATDNPLNEGRVKAEVTKELTAKGFTAVDSGGDLVLTAVGSTKNRQEYTTFYNGPSFGYYYGGFGGTGYQTTTVQNYKVGTLVLDMYSGESKKLLWRSIAKRGVNDSSEARRADLNAAIDQMLSNFPPK